MIETYGSLSLYVGVDKIKCEHYEFQKSLLDLGAVPYGYFYLECDQPYEIGRLYEDLIEYP